MAGKGDKKRPLAVPIEVYGNNYDDIFRKTSEEWCKKTGVQVLDPDGWDRDNFKASWNEKISYAEFESRVQRSTIRLSSAIKARQ
jgi:hypothetical protein